MHFSLPILGLGILISPFTYNVVGRTITVVNSCGSTIWPGMHTGGNDAPSQATGWELASGVKTSFQVDDTWQAGRIWARTGCVVQNGVFQCLTGQCGDGTTDSVLCINSDAPPATLAEFTLSNSGEDNYDISLVDGFNIPLNIIPSISSCPEPQCQININSLCPPLLRTSLDQDGHNLACLSSCNAGFGQEIYGNRACCTGAYADPNLCQACGFDYYSLFKDNCNTSYAYAYDEKSGTALWTCPSSGSSMSDYTIEFCPANSDYVGASTPSNEYVDATATCSNLATAFSVTFTVGPSPTATATIGTLDVVATVATGVDGAAAIAVSATSQSASSAAGATGTSGIVGNTLTASSASSTSNVASITSTAAPVITSAIAATTSAQSSLSVAEAIATESTSSSGSESIVTVYVTTYIYDDDSTTTSAIEAIATGAVSATPTTLISQVTVIGDSTLYEIIKTDVGAEGTDTETVSAETGTSTGAGVVALAEGTSFSASVTTSGATATRKHWNHGQWLTAVPPDQKRDHNARKRRRISTQH